MRSLIIIFFFNAIGISLFAQIGGTKIGAGRIGLTKFWSGEIGKSATPSCKWPQSCSNNPGCPIYIFIGKGDWRIPGNWESGLMPPEILPPCFQILINPVGDEKCVLPSPQYLMPGSSFHVQPGKHIVIPGNMSQKD